MERKLSARILEGSIQVPASKSDAQRAILSAALANGTSKIVNVGNSDDVLSMIGAVTRLGANIKYDKEVLVINGLRPGTENIEVYVGESGLALRLLCMVCASLGGNYQFSGKGTLNNRDHSFMEKELVNKGISVESNSGYLPLKISGKLQSGEFNVNGANTSQFISGLLMGLPILDGNSVLSVENMVSTPYIEMTLKTLAAFGIETDRVSDSIFQIKGNQRYIATQYFVEADWSSASYWIVSAAIGNRLSLKGLNLQSHQADIKILDAVRNAGCEIELAHDALQLICSGLSPFYFDATECPDLFPALVALATFCPGVSELRGVERLKNKESDRGLVLKNEFGKLGVHIELYGDIMKIHGGGSLHGGTVNSHGDHRIAMSLAITATKIREEVVIEGAEAVGKSYPNFWKDLEMLTH